nr:methylase [Clostridiales bacterium]
DNFMFNDEEKNDFENKEPLSKQFFYRWFGADEFINNKLRWCLYLGKASPSELNKMPYTKAIVQKVKEYRSMSDRAQTKKYADYPTRFYLEVIPASNYIVVPVVSSEKRRYIPIGYLTPAVLCSNQLNMIPNASLFHFGVLTSNVHNAWMRTVCGRLKSDYRYSKDIVYNNFPWPTPTDEQKARVEQTAQAILDARALYPDSSLADLYDELTMPAELRKAHQDNDRAVMAAYGFNTKMTESECVAELMKMYQELTKE